MILRERIKIENTDGTTVYADNVPAEASHGQISTVQIVQSDVDLGNVRVSFYGKRQDVIDMMAEERIIVWRGRRHVIDAIPERHYVNGRFHHWEVTTHTNGMIA